MFSFMKCQLKITLYFISAAISTKFVFQDLTLFLFYQMAHPKSPSPARLSAASSFDEQK